MGEKDGMPRPWIEITKESEGRHGQARKSLSFRNAEEAKRFFEATTPSPGYSVTLFLPHANGKWEDMKVRSKGSGLGY